MNYSKFAIVSLLLLIKVHSLIADDSWNCNLNDKNVINIEANNQTYRLYLNVINLNNEKINNNTCNWTIVFPTSNKTIDLSRLALAPSDTLQIQGFETKSSNASVNIYNKTTGKQIESGLLFCDTFSKIEITLQIDIKAKIKRSFEILVIVNNPIIPLMKDSNLITLPLNLDKSATTGPFQLQFEPSEQYSERAIMLNIANLEAAKKASFKINGKSYGINGSLPQFYMSSNSIQFELNSYQQPITLVFWLFTSNCSGEFQLDNDKNSKLPILYPNENYRKEQSLSSIICAQIFKAPNGSYLQLHIDEKMNNLPNPADSMVIYRMEPQMETIQSIEKMSLYYFKSVYSFFDTEQILILYESPYADFKSKNASPPMFISVTKNVTYELKDDKKEKEIQIYESDNETKLIFNIYSLAEQNLIVYFPTDKITHKMVLTVFDSYDIKAKPVAKFNNYEMFPPAIMIPSSMLRIEVSGKLQKMTLKVKYFDPKTDCHFTSNQNITFHVDGSISDCSWYIPSNTEDYTILKPVFINLPNNSTLEVFKLSPKYESLKKLEGPLHESYLPDYAMSSSNDYLIQFKSNNKNIEHANVFISQNSNFPRSTLNKTVDDNQTYYTLKSINYPGNYPLNISQNWIIGKKDITNVTLMTMITVQDIQLIDSHYLLLAAEKKSQTFNKDSDLEKMTDLLYKLPVMASFNTENSSMFTHSGRGFNIDMKYFSCGDVIDLTKDSRKIFGFNTQNLTNYNQNYPMCIWKIEAQKPTEFLNTTTLNFNVSLADKLSETKAEFHLYDAISIRNSSIHFALCKNHTNNYCLNNNVQNGYYQGSIGYAFIIYDYSKSINTKKNFSISITVEKNKCEKGSYNLSTCIYGDRCITEFMACNGLNDCGDWSDELYCNNSYQPIPPIPRGGGATSGVNVWIVLLLLMPLGAILGIIGYIYFPRLLQKFSRGRYTEFRSDLSEVS